MYYMQELCPAEKLYLQLLGTNFIGNMDKYLFLLYLCVVLGELLIMKRINLTLNEDSLKQAVNVLGARTYSEAVNLALEEVIRAAKVRGLSKWIGSNVWEGDLSEMRKDLMRGK
jgi:Arc/MetJ family transcription regulator